MAILEKVEFTGASPAETKYYCRGVEPKTTTESTISIKEQLLLPLAKMHFPESADVLFFSAGQPNMQMPTYEFVFQILSAIDRQ
ncbi:hypothetical protein KIN20_020998 [Parelaphostrongylus tenuis]|uniref:Uncharacterized protein n=1 Tax=Parelaphostrongylus tenuis TaxID=148309 RepID=A0AAD5QVW3_PARTN|nr:hypothetical protein KIN20_020998 [Parelaphostrongylus tenuis]